MEANKNSYKAILGIFNKLSIQRRMLLGGMLVVALVLLGFVILMFNEPNYTVLYAKLEAEDAAQVIDHMSRKKISYKIEDNSETIRVPKDKVYELRFELAAKGIPNSGVIGYELFDNNTLGMSEFMQKLNFKRALEGELSRTIMQQRGIEGVRVHIVVPEKSIFKEEQKEPTASVVLKINPGANLSQSNILAIAHLVSSSVEGLKPTKVAVIDTRGRLLSKETEDNPLALDSGKQYEIKSNVEQYLERKAQSILDNVLGYGNSVVKINADLDFKQVEKTIQSYDPESQVAISEQSIKSESSGSKISDSDAVLTENLTTNYEISKTIERVIEGAGNLRRITVAAVINGVSKEVKNNEIVETVFVPRSDEQLQKLEQIIKQAVGIDETRKDKISLVSIPFETQMVEEIQQEETSPLDDLQKWSNFLLIFIAICASMFVLKGLMKKLKNEKILIGSLNYNDESFADLVPSVPIGTGGGGMSNLSHTVRRKKKALLDVGDIEDEITDEAAQKKMRQDKIVNYVAKNPADAAKLINSWLREDDYQC